jgi:hypothetical protein
MDKFYFDLIGDFAAKDVIGHDCAGEDEAKEHGRFIAHRIGTEKPEMIREGNYISVRNEGRFEVYRAAILSTVASE